MSFVIHKPAKGDVTIIASAGNRLAEDLLRWLRYRHLSSGYRFISVRSLHSETDISHLGACSIYVPVLNTSNRPSPCLKEAEQVFHDLRRLDCKKLVLISSFKIYGIGPNRQGMAPESYCAPGSKCNEGSEYWKQMESLAADHCGSKARLIVLRPVTVHPSSAPLSRQFNGHLIPTLPGHDPTIQLLTVTDLAEAAHAAVEHSGEGAFNVAPDDVLPLHSAIKLVRKVRLPIPRTLQKLWTAEEDLEYLRYSSTVSNARIKKEMGFRPGKTSLTSLIETHGGLSREKNGVPEFDEFGMDRNYIGFYGNTLFKFLSKYYWRIEAQGLENIPTEGPGVLAGTHRGFMPFDGVMTLHTLVQKTGRIPRFLTHPSLLKFPFLANFMTKLGGVLASQESSERILQSGQLLAVFPEGIQGAFTHYRNAYQIQSFGRHSFVKLALRNSAPIVPFVIVGSAEIFPILGKINSNVLSEYTGWPSIPITPTFPFLPVPLPSKWHMQFLPPIHVENQYPPEAARDITVVKAISNEVKSRMQKAFTELKNRRRSAFWGSILEPERP